MTKTLMKQDGHMQAADALEGFVFIVTYGRSGSTLLQNVLNGIPGYLIRGENDNILMHMARSWVVANASPEIKIRREAMQSEGWRDPRYGSQIDPWFGAELIRPDQMGRDLADLFVRDVLRPEAGTRVTGFKEIRYHFAGDDMEAYFDFILTFFPNSRLVFNTRNLNAVARSGWWTEYTREDFMAEVGDADRRFRAYAASRPDRTILMHYDDYNGNVDAFRRLFEFLDEPFTRSYVAALANQKLDHLKKKWK
ncbi:sulfotransferase [Pseudooceanicola nanhaiensis]|uniref:sulfotransferase n=1 Tax=Pseudooceanicola nanhaiensis TaxID=375761 RepID=UPI001CD4519B|nr:sulfotransferase [Pseudooceanicola nanhaiensis]MCA0922805.1 sulfotransferase [Pseudooceanicola nanhaiensis]